MFLDKHLLHARRLLAAALSVAALGMVSPAWAQPDEDEDSGDKKEVLIYRGDDDESGWTEKEDRDESGDREESGDRNDRGDRAKVIRLKAERADAKGGYLGVRVQDITRSLMKARDLPNDEGALVNRVEDDSPAAQAGIERGDVIVQVNREGIDKSQDLIEAMKGIKPGSKIDVVVVRDGARKTLKVDVAKRPRDMMMTAPGFRWRGDGMDPEQMREIREKFHNMDPEMREGMRMKMADPQFRREMDELRKEIESLKEELRDLKEELRDSRGGRPSR